MISRGAWIPEMLGNYLRILTMKAQIIARRGQGVAVAVGAADRADNLLDGEYVRRREDSADDPGVAALLFAPPPCWHDGWATGDRQPEQPGLALACPVVLTGHGGSGEFCAEAAWNVEAGFGVVADLSPPQLQYPVAHPVAGGNFGFDLGHPLQAGPVGNGARSSRLSWTERSPDQL